MRVEVAARDGRTAASRASAVAARPAGTETRTMKYGPARPVRPARVAGSVGGLDRPGACRDQLGDARQGRVGSIAADRRDAGSAGGEDQDENEGVAANRGWHRRATQRNQRIRPATRNT